MEQEQDRGSYRPPVGTSYPVTATSAARDEPFIFHDGIIEGEILANLELAWSAVLTAKHKIPCLIRAKANYVHQDDFEQLEKMQLSLQLLRQRISKHEKVEKMFLVCKKEPDAGT